MEKYYGGYQIADYQEFDDWFIAYPNKDIEIKLTSPELKYNNVVIGIISIKYDGVDILVSVSDKDGNVIHTGSYPSTEDFFDLLTPIITLPINLYGLIRSFDATRLIFDDFIDTFALPLNSYSDNAIEIYLLESSKNTVTKSLHCVGIINGNYNRPITYRDLVVDIVNDGDIPFFNYLYIPKLKRYYYVMETTLMKDFQSLTLHEDVLMSWDSLIRNQSAYVTRNENDYDADKVDELVVYDYNKSKTISAITPTNNFLVYNDEKEKELRFVIIDVYGI